MMEHRHTDDGRFDQPPRTQGALGAFGPLTKVASLRDPCPESPKMVGYTFYFMPGTAENGRLRCRFWEVLVVPVGHGACGEPFCGAP